MIGTNAIAFIQTPILSSPLPKGDGDKGEIHRTATVIEGETTPKLALLSVFASEIRRCIVRARTPAFKDDLTVAQRTMLDAAREGRCYCIVPPAGCFTINGNAK